MFYWRFWLDFKNQLNKFEVRTCKAVFLNKWFGTHFSYMALTKGRQNMC